MFYSADAILVSTSVVDTLLVILSWLDTDNGGWAIPVWDQFVLEVPRLVLPNQILDLVGRELLFLVILMFLFQFLLLHLFLDTLHGLRVF